MSLATEKTLAAISKTLGGSSTASGVGSNGGWIPVYFANSGVLTSAKQTIKASSAINLGGFWFYSDNSVKGFIQLFDVALLASITIGSTVADYTITIPPFGYDKPALIPPGMSFVNGCHAAFTTTKTGSTAMTTGLDCIAFYRF